MLLLSPHPAIIQASDGEGLFDQWETFQPKRTRILLGYIIVIEPTVQT